MCAGLGHLRETKYMERCRYPHIDCLSGLFQKVMQLRTENEMFDRRAKDYKATFIKVHVVTLEVLFERFRIKDLDLMAIDCEGCEDVLSLDSPAWSTMQSSVHWIVGEWSSARVDPRSKKWGYHFSSHHDLFRASGVRLKT